MMSTPTVHCQWEDETARKRTDHLPTQAEAKKMKLPTRHTCGRSTASLRDCSSSSSMYIYIYMCVCVCLSMSMSAYVIGHVGHLLCRFNGYFLCNS